jgi:hypothetical protein
MFAVAPAPAALPRHAGASSRRTCRRGALAAPRASAAAAATHLTTQTTDVDAFWRWLGAQGVDTAAVYPAAVAEGLGLVCTRCAAAQRCTLPTHRCHLTTHTAHLSPTSAVRAGVTVLSVPRGVWMTPATAAASPLGPHLEGQPPWVMLALHLLHERCDRSPARRHRSSCVMPTRCVARC